MKKIYMSPELEKMELQETDVIRTSSGLIGDDDGNDIFDDGLE